MKTENPEYRERKTNTVRSLYAIGESMFARDMEEANEKESFEALEYFMRQKLKAFGPNDIDTHHVRSLANAIVQCQVLPAIRFTKND